MRMRLVCKKHTLTCLTNAVIRTVDAVCLIKGNRKFPLEHSQAKPQSKKKKTSTAFVRASSAACSHRSIAFLRILGELQLILNICCAERASVQHKDFGLSL